MGNILSFRRRNTSNLSSGVDLVDFDRTQYADRKNRRAELLCVSMFMPSST